MIPISLLFFRRPSFVTNKPLFFISKQYIERSKRPIASGDILLHTHLFFVTQIFVAINALFQDPESVPEHHDFVKEIADWDFLWLKTLVERLQQHGPFVPFFAKWYDLRDAALQLQDFQK